MSDALRQDPRVVWRLNYSSGSKTGCDRSGYGRYQVVTGPDVARISRTASHYLSPFFSDFIKFMKSLSNLTNNVKNKKYIYTIVVQ
jgi:hypothetical protein